MNLSQSKESHPTENPQLYYFCHQPYAAAPQQQHAQPQPGMHYHPAPYYYGEFMDGRKQKRRHTAGSFFWEPFRRKSSTAQPRPRILVPPRGIGPVYDFNENDVLCGRGGRINSHIGNVQFRELVQMNKKDYLAKSTKKLQKAHIAAAVVYQVRAMHPPGRYLKEDSTGAWYDIGDKKAIKKVGQALREDGAEVRQELHRNSSDEEGDAKFSSGGSPAATKNKSPHPSPTLSKPKTMSIISLPKSDSSLRVPAVGLHNSPPQQEAVLSMMPPLQKRFSQESQLSSAAVAMQQDDDFDIAFGGKSFHPPHGNVESQREMSDISGLSGPSASMMTGVSLISERSSERKMSQGRHQHYDHLTQQQHATNYRRPASLTPRYSTNDEVKSVASMSINSNCESLNSLPSSILSAFSLTESLNALELAEEEPSKLLDQMQ
jgi:hypothetical protein